MRAFVLAAVGAILIAALLAAGWLGLVLASAAGGDGKPHADPAGDAARRHASARPSGAAWAERASVVCVRSYDQATEAVDDAMVEASGRSFRRITLRLLGRVVRIEERTLARLRRLTPRPRGDRRAIRHALKLFRRELAADRAAVSALRRRWDLSVLVRRSATSGPANERLRLLFVGLGAHGCATLFDADSY